MAQQQTGEEDKDYLTRLLEENLSVDGQEVSITGFKGALSSQATMDVLTIADAVGTWLRLEDVVLDWNRGALLRGRVDVNALTADLIDLSRWPKAPSAAPSAEADEFTGFSLPELPVSVKIAKIEAKKVDLGEEIMGQPVVLGVAGSMSLEGGEGDVALTIERKDEIDGEWVIEGTYSNETSVLRVNVDLAEAEGGVVASALKLPGQPAARLRLVGEGPISDFAADIRLSTDGAERLAGQFRLIEQPVAEGTEETLRQVQLGVGGDIAPLFAPEHRDFLGSDLRLDLLAMSNPSGGWEVETLRFDAESVRFSGQARVAADGWPEHFNLTGEIRDEAGAAVLLPLADQDTRIDAAEFALIFDADQGDHWTTSISIDGVQREDLSVSQAWLSGRGRIHRAETGGIGAVTGDIAYKMRGMDWQSPEISEAVGEQVTGALRASWQAGEALRVEQFALAGADYRMLGDVTLHGMGDGFGADGKVRVLASNLSRFSGLAGRSLGGAVEMELVGTGNPMSGAFDIFTSVTGQDLQVGQAEIDRLLAGTSVIVASVARDETGLTLKSLNLTTVEVKARTKGMLATERGRFDAQVALRNVGLLLPEFTGPISATVTADRDGGDWMVDAEAAQGQNAEVQVSGQVAPDGSGADLQMKGNAALGLVNVFIKPRVLGGVANFDLRLAGPLALSSLSGWVETSQARFSAPTLRMALENIAARAEFGGSAIDVTAEGNLSTGGRLELRGPIALTAPYSGDLQVVGRAMRLIDPQLYDVVMNADLSLSGALAGGARIAGRVDVEEAEFRVPTADSVMVGNLPGLVHVNESTASRRSRARAGLIEDAKEQQGRGAEYALDVTINAPGRVFVRGRGLDAELGGQVNIGGTSQNVVPDGGLELLRGRLDILGQRLILSEGLVQLQGSLLPWLRMVAEAQVPDALVRVVVEGLADNPEIRFESQPELPEDEVLALLLFGRSVTEISAFQAAQLAAAVATLSGRGGEGVIGRLRQKFGLDDFDVSSTEEGGTEVKAGKYLSENVYTEVEVGQDGSSDINLILDLNPSVTVKGGVGEDGDTSLGIFFERDY